MPLRDASRDATRRSAAAARAVDLGAHDGDEVCTQLGLEAFGCRRALGVQEAEGDDVPEQPVGVGAGETTRVFSVASVHAVLLAASPLYRPLRPT
jgi:hypothetical protein